MGVVRSYGRGRPVQEATQAQTTVRCVCLPERLSKLVASGNKKAKNVRRVDHSYSSLSYVSSSYSTVSSLPSPAGERMDLGSKLLFLLEIFIQMF